MTLPSGGCTHNGNAVWRVCAAQDSAVGPLESRTRNNRPPISAASGMAVGHGLQAEQPRHPVPVGERLAAAHLCCAAESGAEAAISHTYTQCSTDVTHLLRQLGCEAGTQLLHTHWVKTCCLLDIIWVCTDTISNLKF